MTHEDAVALCDLAQQAIPSGTDIRQIALQAARGLEGRIAFERVAGNRLWFEVVDNARQLGVEQALLARIRVWIDGRTDVGDLRTLIDRLLAR